MFYSSCHPTHFFVFKKCILGTSNFVIVVTSVFEAMVSTGFGEGGGERNMAIFPHGQIHVIGWSKGGCSCM